MYDVADRNLMGYTRDHCAAGFVHMCDDQSRHSDESSVSHGSAVARIADRVASNEVLQTIFDHIPAMIALVDDENRFLAINREFRRVMACSDEEVLGRNDILKDWLPDDEVRQRGMEFVQRAEGTWQEFRVLVRGRFIDTVWTNIRLSDGRIISFGRDITEQKRVEHIKMEARELLEAAVQDDFARGNQYG